VGAGLESDRGSAAPRSRSKGERRRLLRVRLRAVYRRPWNDARLRSMTTHKIQATASARCPGVASVVRVACDWTAFTNATQDGASPCRRSCRAFGVAGRQIVIRATMAGLRLRTESKSPLPIRRIGYPTDDATVKRTFRAMSSGRTLLQTRLWIGLVAWSISPGRIIPAHAFEAQHEIGTIDACNGGRPSLRLRRNVLGSAGRTEQW